MIKRSTWILLAVLAVFIGAYFYLKAHPLRFSTSTPTPTATETSFLITKDNDTLTKVVITDAEGDIFQMGRDAADNWAITKPKPAAADQSKAEAAETQLFALRILTTLETSPSPDAIGLNPPADTISLEFSSSRLQVLKVGSLTPTGSGYYVQLEDKIYVISKDAIDAVLKLLQNPPYLATPTPLPATETSVPVTATP